MAKWTKDKKTLLRLVLAVLMIPSLIHVGLDIGIVSGGDQASRDSQYPDTISHAELNGATIIASQTGSLSVVSTNGTIVARISEHDSYFDVDLVNSLGSATLLYTATDYISKSECLMRTACVQNSIETYNLTTGKTKTLFTQTIPKETAPQWHDADYSGHEQVIIADMSRDRVFEVNTTTGIITWQWQAGQAFNLSSGSQHFEDWTHLNDVTALSS